MIEYILISYVAMLFMGLYSIIFDWVDWYEAFAAVLMFLFAPLCFLLILVGWSKSLWRLL
jgi:hypothetical protein